MHQTHLRPTNRQPNLSGLAARAGSGGGVLFTSSSGSTPLVDVMRSAMVARPQWRARQRSRPPPCRLEAHEDTNYTSDQQGSKSSTCSASWRGKRKWRRCAHYYDLAWFYHRHRLQQGFPWRFAGGGRAGDLPLHAGSRPFIFTPCSKTCF